ncbi:Chorismate mutase [Quillaja saponaria]|uniref:Chorismate mutase n=1 Tax=Quillaja saponaria TaxID=32244 RepID=A0AAD7LIB9_QUISA|nr:Chorismate mutase [Quillaja saponaria]
MFLRILVLILVLSCDSFRTVEADSSSFSANGFTLESVRDALTRQEDTIVFSLIERAKFPINSQTYNESYVSVLGFRTSLVGFIVRNTEAIEAKAGRYKNHEENPFLPGHLPLSVVPSYPYPEVLHPAAAFININKSIWKMYFGKLLPSITAPGDDGNYASTAASDLTCLQALSRRIHYGKFVAEVKFRESPQDYEPAIRSQDREALLKLLTSESVEEMVKKRVGKKAMVFGQDVSLDTNDNKGNYKVNPSIVSRLYGQWVIPLTKLVEVEYLLRRLD